MPVKDQSYGTLSYNGFTFSHVWRKDIDSSFVYDDSGRAVKWVAHTLTLSGLVYADDEATEATSMDSMRTKLSAPGKKFTMTGHGYGDLTIGGNANTKDANFGPLPKVISYAPLGGGICWEVVWQVTWHVNPCESRSNIWGIVAFNYVTNYDYDHRGICTRATSGTAEIEQSRNGLGTVMRRSLATVWEKIRCDLPIGYRRMSANHSFNEAYNKVAFSYADKEFDTVPFPANVVDCSFGIRGNSANAVLQTGTIGYGGSITVKPGTSLKEAARIYFSMAASAVKAILNSRGNPSNLIIRNFSFDWPQFTREISFDTQFNYTGSMQTLMSDAGFWSIPESQTGWSAWSKSINPLFEPNGWRDLREGTDPHAIVEFCDPSIGSNNLDIKHQIKTPVNSGRAVTGVLCDVSPGKSYLMCDIHIVAESDQTPAVHQPSATVSAINTAAAVTAAVNPASAVAMAAAGMLLPAPSDVSASDATVTQTLAAPKYKVSVFGVIERAKFEPTLPRLKKAGGATAVLAKNVTHRSTKRADACLIHRLEFAQTYILDKSPTGTLEVDAGNDCKQQLEITR